MLNPAEKQICIYRNATRSCRQTL